jgi:hypothetical protein
MKPRKKEGIKPKLILKRKTVHFIGVLFASLLSYKTNGTGFGT